MYPTFERGSVAIIKKIGEDHSKLDIGEIIAYHYENKIIAHRIAKITEINGKKYFYTKGGEHYGNVTQQLTAYHWYCGILDFNCSIPLLYLQGS